MEETFDHVPGKEKDQVSLIYRYRTNLGDFRHCCTIIIKVYINGHERGKNCRKQLNNVWMNFSPACRQKPERQCRTTIYCKRNSIFRIPSGFVRAKKYLAGHHDWHPAVHYFEPWVTVIRLSPSQVKPTGTFFCLTQNFCTGELTPIPLSWTGGSKYQCSETNRVCKFYRRVESVWLLLHKFWSHFGIFGVKHHNKKSHFQTFQQGVLACIHYSEGYTK